MKLISAGRVQGHMPDLRKAARSSSAIPYVSSLLFNVVV